MALVFHSANVHIYSLFSHSFFRLHFSVDAALDLPGWSGEARFINHCKKSPNLKAHVVVTHDDHPHVVLRSVRAIAEDEELTFDYGDRRQAIIDANSWLSK